MVANQIPEPACADAQKQDPSLIESQVAEIRRVARWGLTANIFLSMLKLTAGFWSSSQAVIADGVHSLSDCITDLAILVGVRFWSEPPDTQHPYGHHRIETLVTIFIGFVLAIAALGMMYDAILSFNDPPSAPPGIIALAAALFSIFAKEGLYRWTKSVGTRIKSSALIANAWHQRSDALSSIPVAIAVAAASINPDLRFLDGVGAMLVCLFILYAAWSIIAPGIGQLVDRGASNAEVEIIRRLALDQKGVLGVHKVRTRYSGMGLQVDLHVQVEGAMSVHDGHEVAGLVKTTLLTKSPNVVDVVVHIEPHE
ncbi:MAG: cation transporter [Proteobacteria bacterium]|nr:cation transporter [Pseudomonadota bacterium]